MATQYRSGVATGNPGAGTFLDVSLPAGMTAGDLVVITGEVCDVDATFSVPAGWTVNDEDFDAAFVGQNAVIVTGFWDGVATTVRVTSSVANIEGWYFTALAFYDDAAGSIGVTGAQIATSASSPSATAVCPAAAGGGATDTVVRAVALSFFNNSSFDSSAPAGYTNPSVSVTSNPGIRRGYAAAYYDLSDDGNTSKNITSSGNNYWVAFTVSIGAVAPPCNPPGNDGGTYSPMVTGTLGVGNVLHCDPGFWTGDATITFTYQWFRVCGTDIELLVGETADDYTQVTDDIGCDLFCEVTGSNGCSPDGVADSNTVGPVPEPPTPPVNVTPPVVSGAHFPGHEVITTNGTWSGTLPMTFTYQWQIMCGTLWDDIVGETSQTLDIIQAYVGCYVRCVVTAHNSEDDVAQASNAILITENIPAAVEICESPLWRFVITELDSTVITFLDRLARNRTVTYILNGPTVITGTVPSDSPEINIPHTDGDPFLAEGNRLLYGFRLEPQGGGVSEWICRAAGIILQIEDAAQQDNADSSYTAFDPWQYLRSRPVRNGPDFDYTLPGVNGSSYTATRIDVIAGEILHNTIVTDGTVHIDAGPLYGGTAFWGGTIEPCDQIDINFEQGLSVGDAWTELVSTSQADFVLTAIWDPVRRPGYTHELSIFTQAGTIVDEAIFGWDKIPRNVIGISDVIEGSSRANNVKFFSSQGGTVGGGQTIPVQVDAASVSKYGAYWAQTFFPGQNVPAAVLALAESQLEIRKTGRRTVTVSPSPDCATQLFTAFFVGDRVHVGASDRMREALDGYQRIYGIPLVIADDSTETIERMLCSKQGVSP